MVSLKLRPSQKKRLILILVVAAFLAVDAVAVWYTVSFTVEDKPYSLSDTPFEIVSLERSQAGTLLILATDGVYRSTQSGYVSYGGLPPVTGASIGDSTDSVAILTADGTVRYYAPEGMTPSFSVRLNGSAVPIGISEVYGAPFYFPEDIVVIVRNDSGDRIVLLSVTRGGAIDWEYDLPAQAIAFSRSENTRYFGVALSDASVMLFKRTQAYPVNTFALPMSARELVFSTSGLHFATLTGDNPSRVSLYEMLSTEPVFEGEIAGQGSNLMIQKEDEAVYVQASDSVFRVSRDGVSLKVSQEGLETYRVATTVDNTFVLSSEGLYGYRGQRSVPIWRADVNGWVGNLTSDPGGNLVLGWNRDSILMVDNTEVILGSKPAWVAFGLIVIAECTILPLALAWRRLRALKKGAVYVLAAGAFVGIAILAIFPDDSAAAHFGGTLVYLAMAGIIAAVAAVVSWNSEAGLGGIVFGAVAGLATSLPVALVVHFALWAFGFDFGASGSPYYSIGIGLLTGLKMGIAGSITGFAMNLMPERKGKNP